MGIFGKKSKINEINTDISSNAITAPKKVDNRYEEYINYANELPLLTDDELKRFVLTGEQTVVSFTSFGVSWASTLNTQFLIRLRRTLLDKLPDNNEKTNGS